MSGDRLDQAMRAAIAAGILPATASRPDDDSRPWPVVLLTALGAWLAAIPLLSVLGLLLADTISRGIGPYIVGALVLSGAMVVLRSREVPFFVEQLAVPALLVGGGSLAFGLFRDMPVPAGAALLALVALGVAGGIARPWLRVLLGATAAALTALAFLPRHWDVFGQSQTLDLWFAIHASLVPWLVAPMVQHNLLIHGRTPQATALESLSAGWLLAILTGLAWWSGMTFLVGATTGSGFAGQVPGVLGERMLSGWATTLPRLASLTIAVAAAIWMWRSWPALRRPWYAGAAAVLVALAWFMPSLGAVWLALALCVCAGRWKLATAAGFVAAWIIGSFYYQLSMPLASKAALLVVAGAALGALSWLASRGEGLVIPPKTSTAEPATTRKTQAGIALGALAVLIVANAGIWQKEDLIAHGQPVYVELAPVDPRSLMQGDYMQLNFRIPGEVSARLDSLSTRERPRVIARRDARGIATPLRLDDGGPLSPDEFRFELTPKNGRWILVSDAWFFGEGEAQRWAKAKYGEFRIGGNGRALLVGLRGPDLEEL